jgi:hypothetical protein
VGVSYNPSIVTDGLVLCLDAANRHSYSGSGSTWNDLSKEGNNATLYNGPSFTNNNSGGLVFDGTNEYFMTDLNTIGQANTSFTFGGYFYNTTNTHNNNRFIFSNYVTSSHDGFFAITTYTSTPILRLWMRDSSRGNNIQSNGVVPQVGAWYHVIGVRNHSNSTAQFYIDGELIHSYPYSGSVSVTDGGTSYFGGVLHNGASQIIPATVSSVQLYNRALSASEVQQNFNATRGRYGI